MDGIFFFLSFSLNLPWLVGLRHRILASAWEGICSSSVLQAEKQILFTEFNPLCMLAGLGCLARRWWGRDCRKRAGLKHQRGGWGAASRALGGPGVQRSLILVLPAAPRVLGWEGPIQRHPWGHGEVVALLQELTCSRSPGWVKQPRCWWLGEAGWVKVLRCLAPELAAAEPGETASPC